jgi:hypothetical protein
MPFVIPQPDSLSLPGAGYSAVAQAACLIAAG